MAEECCPPGSEVDLSLLTTNDLRMTFGPTEHLKAIQTFVVSCTFPSVSLGSVPTNYRNNQGFTAGETLTYDALTCRLAADEKLKVYLEVYDWMYSNTRTGRQKKFDKQYKVDGREGPYGLHTADVTLQLLTSHNNVTKTFIFRNAFPTSIGGPEFNTQQTDTVYAMWDVNFQYDYFDIE